MYPIHRCIVKELHRPCLRNRCENRADGAHTQTPRRETDVSDAKVATRSRENTRARLLDAAFEVFAEVGLDAASVEAICERAGFTRGAFYSNFDSKDELFLELVTGVAEQKLAAVTARVRELASAQPRPTTPEEIVQRVVDISVDTRRGVLLMSEIRIKATESR
ncbi:MAG: helix-turn-helix transcriptional regulator [Microbacterium sp.]|nr:helix-turn-helix transcriptional regulator [Microbacterium sp.]